MHGPDADGPSPGPERFEETRWTEIGKVRTGDPHEKQQVLERLCERYWKPVYSYLRFRGQSHDSALDLTQAFFTEIVFDRELIAKADRSRGRFRTLLLTALDAFVHQEHRRRRAQKRSPAGGVSSLFDEEGEVLAVCSKAATPEDAFAFAWAAALVQEVVAHVGAECLADGLQPHWRAFEARVLDPLLRGSEPVDPAALCEELDVQSPSRISNMVITIKRRFRSALRDRIRRQLRPGEDVEEEIRELLEILSVPRAG